MTVVRITWIAKTVHSREKAMAFFLTNFTALPTNLAVVPNLESHQSPRNGRSSLVLKSRPHQCQKEVRKCSASCLLPTSTSNTSSSHLAWMRRIFEPSLVANVAGRAKRAAIVKDLVAVAEMLVLVQRDAYP